MNEFETKVLNIDPEAIIKKLRELGAEEIAEVLQKRYVYDIESSDAEYIRLRTNGTKTTITYKHKLHGNTIIGKTEELEVEVSDFETAAAIFSKIKFNAVYYEENKRHIFHLQDIEFCIDYWPKIPPLLEIEANSVEKVKAGLKLLGLEDQDAGDKDMVAIYADCGMDLHGFKELKF